jgi:hypothetical protein
MGPLTGDRVAGEALVVYVLEDAKLDRDIDRLVLGTRYGPSICAGEPCAWTTEYVTSR